MTENDVFRKIKELSLRAYNPRPTLDTGDIAAELCISHSALVPTFIRLKELRLVSYSQSAPTKIKLTLLGTVVNR